MPLLNAHCIRVLSWRLIINLQLERNIKRDLPCWAPHANPLHCYSSPTNFPQIPSQNALLPWATRMTTRRYESCLTTLLLTAQRFGEIPPLRGSTAPFNRETLSKYPYYAPSAMLDCSLAAFCGSTTSPQHLRPLTSQPMRSRKQLGSPSMPLFGPCNPQMTCE